MNLIPLSIAGAWFIEGRRFEDDRGWFQEWFKKSAVFAQTGFDFNPVQTNISKSAAGSIRGIHYSIAPQGQGKLVTVMSGSIDDFVIDVRPSSPTFGKWVGEILSAQNRKQLWIPPGFAHGFLVLSETAEFLYKTTNFFAPQFERCIAWNDPTIGIDWKLEGINPLLSVKDTQGKPFTDIDY